MRGGHRPPSPSPALISPNPESLLAQPCTCLSEWQAQSPPACLPARPCAKDAHLVRGPGKLPWLLPLPPPPADSRGAEKRRAGDPADSGSVPMPATGRNSWAHRCNVCVSLSLPLPPRYFSVKQVTGGPLRDTSEGRQAAQEACVCRPVRRHATSIACEPPPPPKDRPSG